MTKYLYEEIVLVSGRQMVASLTRKTHQIKFC